MLRFLIPMSTLAVGSPAWALDCMAGIYASDPADGDVDVPLNVGLVFHRTNSVGTDVVATVLDDAGAPVSVAVEAADSAVWVRPDEDLAPFTTYQVEVTDGGWSAWSATFETGDQVDTERPVAPEILSIERHHDVDRDWGTTSGMQVELADPAERVFWEYEIALDPDFQDPFSVTASQPTPFLGQGLCDATFPEYQREVRYYVRVRAIDRAGNTSDWVQRVSEVAPGTLMTDFVGGCSTSPSVPGGALWLGAVGLVARRRRSATT